MSLREFVVLAFILYILVVQLTAARFHTDEEEDDDDEKYDLLKRVLFHKPTVASTQRSPNVIDNLVYPSSIKQPTILTQKSTYSPDYSEDNCQPNICNTGRCISLKTTYYCQCPDDHYGEHCEKRFSKRKIRTLESYHKLLHQLKRGMFKQDMKDMQKSHKDHDIAYYDVKNRIYF